MRVTLNGSTISEFKELDMQCSQGNLKKWVCKIGDKTVYIKSHSPRGYECESECISSRLAMLLGIDNVVLYHLGELKIGSNTLKVCYSQDFIGVDNYKSFNTLFPYASVLDGKEKYDYIISNLSPVLKIRLDTILLFDSIIANDDRHLRNLGVLTNSNIIPLFDNGNSLFYNKTVKSIKHTLKCSDNYLKCKPFFSTHGNQLSLLDINNIRLNSVTYSDVCSIVRHILGSNERSKLVVEFLCRRLEVFGLLC